MKNTLPSCLFLLATVFADLLAGGSVARAADYAVATTATSITVTDLSGNADSLSITQPSANNLQFVAIGRTFSINGGPDLNNGSGALDLSGITSVIVNAQAGDDIIVVGGFTTTGGFPGLTINGGIDNDAVFFNGDITFRNGVALNVDLQDDAATPGVDQILVDNNANLILAGTGSATFKASQDIEFSPGSSLVTVNGNLVVAANQQASATSGSFIGILLDGATVEATGTGVVTAQGRGGNSGSGAPQYGVGLQNGAVLRGGTSGTLTVTGVGGAASGNFHAGVSVDGVNTRITSNGGNVSVTGQGGGAGTSGNNWGAVVARTAQISAGGAGTVTVIGTGGTAPGGQNYGVYVVNSDTWITSSGGNVSVTGQGGGTGTSGGNIGVFAANGGQISAGSAGTVTVIGTGGASFNNLCHGVAVGNATPGLPMSARISSAGGNVRVTGQGGGAGAGSVNKGVFVFGTGQISAGGAGTVTVTGTGGAATGSQNNGVHVTDVNSSITSSSGNVSVTGTGTATSAAIAVDNSGAITTATTPAPILITADSLAIASAGTITAGTGLVTLQPRTAGTLIDLGAADVLSGSPLTLGLTDAELDQITAGTLILGRNTSGLFTVSADITRPASTAVQLTSGADIVQNSAGGSFNTGGGTLLLTPGASGNHQPLRIGTDVAASAASFTGSSELRIAITGLAVDTQYTQLNVAGTVGLTGVDLALTGAFVPALGDVFTIVSASSVTGVFNGLNDGSSLTFNGRTLQIDYTATTVTLADITPLPVVNLSLSAASATEAAATAVTVTATADAPVSGDQTVTVNVTGAGISAGDYTLDSTTLTILGGQTQGSVTFTVVDDSLDEANETAVISLSNPSSGLLLGATTSQNLVITDNDSAGITVTPTTGLITTEAGGTATFTVVLTSQPTADVSLDLTSSDTSEGTVAPASLVFTAANWNVARTATVTGVNDAIDDGNIAYTIVTAQATSADPAYAVLNPPDVAVSNTDDDSASLSITDASLDEGNSGTVAFVFTVTLSSASASPVTVNYATADGTATAGSDYTAVPSTVLTFTPGQTSKPITVLVNGDTLFEPDETFSVILSAPSAATLADGQASGTIINDDAGSNGIFGNGFE